MTSLIVLPILATVGRFIFIYDILSMYPVTLCITQSKYSVDVGQSRMHGHAVQLQCDQVCELILCDIGC